VKLYQDSEFGVGEYDSAGALRAGRIPEHQMILQPTHALTGEGFDASEDGTGRGTPLVPVHAFDARQSDVLQYGDISGPMDTGFPGPTIMFQRGRYGRMDGGTQEGEGDLPTGAVRSVRGDGCGSASQERGLARPRAEQPSASLPKLPHEGAPFGSEMPAVRQAAQGAGVLRHALPEAEEAGRSGEGRNAAATDLLAAGLHDAEPLARAMREARAAAEARHARPGAAHQERGRVAPMAVRRLTPTECERLQGFPDEYTLIQHRGKPAADGPRYKALGNSWAVPCARWIGERIEAAAAIQQLQEAA
jgi:DNA (cytosine-5)-methyltransferase 1